MKLRYIFATLAVAPLWLVATANAATLYSENFDVDPTASWNVNNNGNGVNAANFFFDYSTVGIPAAPNSGSSTRGLKLGANLGTAPTTGNIPGISVSPTGQSFSGDYTLTFDWWSNYIGPLNVGATGSTMLSTFGIQSSGTTSNFPGVADSVYFAATGDGQSSADYRIYSSEAPTSYAVGVTGVNAHVVYAAGNTNQSAALYTTLFPAGATAPGSQSGEATQTSSTIAGAAGFRWHAVEIKKVGSIVTWSINGTLIATVNESLFTGTLPAGSNILFGMSDTNLSTNASPTLLDKLQFTLIDNVTVTDIPEPATLVLFGMAVAGAFCIRRRG